MLLEEIERAELHEPGTLPSDAVTLGSSEGTARSAGPREYRRRSDFDPHSDWSSPLRAPRR
jgi:hypothetical protein